MRHSSTHSYWYEVLVLPSGEKRGLSIRSQITSRSRSDKRSYDVLMILDREGLSAFSSSTATGEIAMDSVAVVIPDAST